MIGKSKIKLTKGKSDIVVLISTYVGENPIPFPHAGKPWLPNAKSWSVQSRQYCGKHKQEIINEANSDASSTSSDPVQLLAKHSSFQGCNTNSSRFVADRFHHLHGTEGDRSVGTNTNSLRRLSYSLKTKLKVEESESHITLYNFLFWVIQLPIWRFGRSVRNSRANRSGNRGTGRSYKGNFYRGTGRPY